jgi:hypothetical protein
MGEGNRQSDVFSQFSASTSTKKVLEAFKKKYNLLKQEERESDSTRNYPSAAANDHRIDEHKTHLESKIAQNFLN